MWRLPPEARTVMSGTERKELGRIFDLGRIKGALRLVPVGGVPVTCEVFEVCEAFHGLALAILSRRSSHHRRYHRAQRFTMTAVPGCLLALLPPPSPGHITHNVSVSFSFTSVVLGLGHCTPVLSRAQDVNPLVRYLHPLVRYPHPLVRYPHPLVRYPHQWFVTHTHRFVTPHPPVRYRKPTSSLPHSHWFVTAHPLVRYDTPTGSLPHTH